MSKDLIVRLTPGAIEARRKTLVESFWEGKAPRTVKAYKEDLFRVATYAGKDTIEDFARFFLALGPGEAWKLTHEFKAWGLTDKGWAPSYVNNHLAALRSLVKFARRAEVIVWTLDIEDARVETYRDTRGPGFEGLVAIIKMAAAQEDPFVAARDTALVALMATMGLRRDEVVSLDLEHVDFLGKRVLVKRKKRTQRVWVTVPGETLETLLAWRGVRGTEPGPLFISRAIGRKREDGRLAESSVWALVKALAEQAGYKAWPHGLRHAAITEVLELTDGNVRAAQKFAGHTNMNTTMRYDDNRRDVAGEMAGKLALAIREALEKK